MKTLTPEEELDVRRSVNDFQMRHIFPKLSKETQKKIMQYIDEGSSVEWAFQMAGVKMTTFID